MTTALLRLMLVLAIALMQWALFRIVRRDRGLGLPAATSASMTFHAWVWTVLILILGTAGFLTLPALSVTGFLVSVNLLVIARIWEAPAGPSIMSILRARWRLLGFTPLPFVMLAALAVGVLLPLGIWMIPIDFDGLNYHIGTTLHMYQDGDFRIYEGETGYTNYFSRGAEFFGLMLMFLTGSVLWLNVVQWVGIPPLVFAMYAAARSLGCGRNLSLVAASWPFAVPVLLYQANYAYSDLASQGWLVVAACAVLTGRASRRPGGVRMLWMFAAGGLAICAKLNAATGTVVIGLAAMALWGWRAFLLPRRGAVGLAVTGFLMAALAGLWWPVRNWVVAGSPVYPFALTIGSTTIAPAPLPMEGMRLMPETPPPGYTVEQWLQFPLSYKVRLAWTRIDLESWRRHGPLGLGMRDASIGELHDHSYGYTGDGRKGGLGAAWLLLLFPSSFIFAGVAFFRLSHESGRTRRLAGHWLALFVMCWGLFFLTLAPWWPRFVIYLPLLGALMFVPLLGTLRAGRRRRLYPLVYMLALLLFAKDSLTAVVQNRGWEIQRRIAEARDQRRPIDYFLWAEPDNPRIQAIATMIDHARDGETISYHSPHDPIGSGIFTNVEGTIRLFFLPSVFPFPEDYTHEEQLGWLLRERVALILLTDASPPEFEELLSTAGAVPFARFPGHRVLEFPAHRIDGHE